jgi:hypothetical protein
LNLKSFFPLGIELIEPRPLSSFALEMKRMMNLTSDNDDNDQKKKLNLIVNVLTKIYFIFGQEPFIDRSLHNPFFLYVKQMWFQQIKNEENQRDIQFLLNGWTSILTQWVKFDYQNRRKYIEQINPDQLDNDDD